MIELNKIWNEDCLLTMSRMEDNSIDLVLTDPPYGKMWTRGVNGFGTLKDKNENDKTEWDIKPSKEYFNEILRISKNQIIFGGNYFTDYLYPTNCWIVWDKKGDSFNGNPFADCELAWTSFNKVVKKYSLRQQGFVSDSQDTRQHPTQKPSELFIRILKDFSEEGQTAYDPFLGSGTTAIACQNLKRNWIGSEISKEYCEIAEQRLRQKPLL